jgi:Hemerythrin HHE cation binding domain
MAGPDARTRAILEEHERLRELTRAIEQLLSQPPSEAGAPSWLADLATRVKELLPRIEAHFADEEMTGFFEAIQRARPEAARTCATLIGEHRAFVARLDRLRADAESQPSDGGTLGALADRGRELLRDLARHESTERELAGGSNGPA